MEGGSFEVYSPRVKGNEVKLSSAHPTQNKAVRKSIQEDRHTNSVCLPSVARCRSVQVAAAGIPWTAEIEEDSPLGRLHRCRDPQELQIDSGIIFSGRVVARDGQRCALKVRIEGQFLETGGPFNR